MDITALDNDIILLAHGDGGALTHDLITGLFQKHFTGQSLKLLTDAALLPHLEGPMAFTTDSFVVDPLFFPGGNIGELAVYGTVNDLAVSGACPRYLAVAFVIEEGLPLATLEKVVQAMAAACRETKIEIVAGDTKVVPKGQVDKLFITTTGLGAMLPGVDLGYHRLQPRDMVLVNGQLGQHALTIMASRYNLDLGGNIQSDCAPLAGIISELLQQIPGVKLMRDLTRGGLATAVKEIALSAQIDIYLDEEHIPVTPAVQAAADILGLDPLYLANEGKFLAVIAPENKKAALEVLKAYPLGKQAAIIGEVHTGEGNAFLRTAWGGTKFLDLLAGAPLPRLC